MGTVDERRRRRPEGTSSRTRRENDERQRNHLNDNKNRRMTDAERRRRIHRQYLRRKKKKSKAGKIIALLQLMISVVFLALLWNLGVLPGKYLTVMALGCLMLFGICFGLQFGRKGGSITGIVFSLILSCMFAFGSYYIQKMDSAIGKVGGATYKTDNMVVVVRKDDKAQKLEDASDYSFGYQTLLDTDNTDKMIAEVNKKLGKEIELTQYESVEEMAQALLNGEVDAAIYNEAFNGMIDDTIEDYESQIRILYQYGINTKLVVEEKSVKEPFSVYISGIDVYGKISKNSRSDVNIIMTVNPETKQILLTSTPRDYYVPIPGISHGRRDKLTHAGIYGVDKSMATLEEIYGIDISYYARVNFTSLIKIIDVLGGVDVNSEVSFSAGGYSFKKGMNHMNGKQALAFARERKSFAAGDNQRGKNQQAVITAIIKKAMSPAILTNANSLLASVSDSVETNMSKDEMTELIRMQLNDGASWNITSANAVGTGDKQSCFSSGSQLLYVMQPNMSSVSEIKAKMNQVIDGENIQ